MWLTIHNHFHNHFQLCSHRIVWIRKKFLIHEFDYRTCQTNRPIPITLVKQIEIWTYAIPADMKIHAIGKYFFFSQFILWLNICSCYSSVFFVRVRFFWSACADRHTPNFFFSSHFCSHNSATPKAFHNENWPLYVVHNESCRYISFGLRPYYWIKHRLEEEVNNLTLTWNVALWFDFNCKSELTGFAFIRKLMKRFYFFPLFTSSSPSTSYCWLSISHSLLFCVSNFLFAYCLSRHHMHEFNNAKSNMMNTNKYFLTTFILIQLKHSQVIKYFSFKHNERTFDRFSKLLIVKLMYRLHICDIISF